MRLTLRTLLAYLDDILDAGDKEELNKKIESSEFAGDLILRTRDTMRRLRLSAPQVVGTGMGLDPNTVAEYLDNALPPDQVGDFERICLESDMHLAEVASAHHVLTMVLGSPADVEPAARSRMYSIPHQVAERKHLRTEGAHRAVGAAGSAPATVPAVAVDNRAAAVSDRSLEVPEYLRTSAWSRYGWFLVGLAALLLVAATIVLSSGMADWFGSNVQTAGTTPTALPNGATDEQANGATDETNAAGVTTEEGAEPADGFEPTGPTNQLAEEDLATSADPAGPSFEAPSESTTTDSTAGLSAGSVPLASPPPPHTPGVTPVPTTTGSTDPYAVTSSQPSDIAAGETTATVDTGTPFVDSSTTTAPADTAALTPDPFRSVPTEPATRDAGPFVPFDPAATPQDTVTTETDPSAAPMNPAEAPTETPASAADPGDRYGTAAPPAATLPSDSNSLADEAPAPPIDAPPGDGNAGDPTMRVADSGGGARLGDAAAADLTDPPFNEEAEDEKLPDLGTYLGGKTVLLRWNDSPGAWFRVSPRSAVMAGDRLLALPEFRPKLTFGSGIHMDLSGGTRVTVDRVSGDGSVDLPAARADVPLIDVVYGRVVLLNTAESANSVRLALGSATTDVELERNATLAVEVERKFVPGNDPRKTASPIVVTLYAPDGGVIWHGASGEQQIDEPAQWTIADGAMSEITPSPTLPEWIDHEPLEHRSEQLYGAPVVEETLTTEQPAGDQLLELFAGGERKRKEVKSLSARSSIHVGLFVPFVEALRDSQQRPNWENHIETLRAAMSLDPQAAESIWQTLVDQRGEAAARDLYEMLCGYRADQVGSTPEEVRAGVVPDLIDRLENDSLDYRVLAVQNLADLTGKRLMRNPAANATERSQNVRQWRRRLESGELAQRE